MNVESCDRLYTILDFRIAEPLLNAFVWRTREPDAVSACVVVISSLIFGASGAWLASRFAGKAGLWDCPNERSSHSAPTPKGGGIGILASFLLCAVYSGSSITFWLPLTAVSLIAFYGDWVNLSPKLRLYAQFLLTAILVAGSGLGPSTPLWYLPWLVFWTVFIVGTANFYNFMDGINGLAGVTGVIAFGLMGWFFCLDSTWDMYDMVAIGTSLACLGFLPMNMPNARVFMGDIGSILLGAAFGGLVFLASRTFLDILCLVSFLFPFYADELTTMVVRLKDGENLTQPHRRHIYQLLSNEKGIPHWKVSVGFGMIQLLVGVCSMLLKPYGAWIVLAFLVGCFFAFALVGCYIRIFLGRSFPSGTSDYYRHGT